MLRGGRDEGREGGTVVLRWGNQVRKERTGIREGGGKSGQLNKGRSSFLLLPPLPTDAFMAPRTKVEIH